MCTMAYLEYMGSRRLRLILLFGGETVNILRVLVHILKFHLSFDIHRCHTITGKDTITLCEHLVLQ